MKLKAFLFVFTLFVTTLSHAQSMEEVVYLKNGSIVRGVIIEQVPNVSLKIQTANGSIFAYPMEEVEKITKEASVHSYSSDIYAYHTNRFADRVKEYGSLIGYHGFVDVDYSFGVDDWRRGRFEVSTSHGCQILPYLFVGGGVGFQDWNGDDVGLPIFAHIRGTSPVSRVAQPFLDGKIGYALLNANGFYTSVSVGCHFAMERNAGISVSLGCSVQMTDWWRGRHNFVGLSLKTSFDW